MSRPMLAAALFGALSSSALAQSVETTKVKTRLLQYAAVPIDAMDYENLDVRISIGKITAGTPVFSQFKQQCILNDKPVEATVWGGKVTYSGPDSLTVVRDQAGRVAYAEMYPMGGQATVAGCSASKQVAQQRWKEEGLGSISVRKEIKRIAKDELPEKVFFQYEKDSFHVASASGSHDYTALDEAQAKAVAAYGSIAESGMSAAAQAELRASIAAWEAALEDLDLNDKTARINKKVGIALYHNIIDAAVYTGDFALANSTLAKRSRVGLVNSAGRYADKARARIARLQVGMAANPGEDFAAYQAHMDAISKPKVKPKMARQSYDQVAGEVAQWKQQFAAMEAEATASNSAPTGKYDASIRNTPTGRELLMPAGIGPKLTAFPEDLCEMTDLQGIRLEGHDIPSIPPCVTEMGNLKVLSLSGNAIKELPAGITQMDALKILNLNNNELATLPDGLAAMKSLKTVSLKKNPLDPGAIASLQAANEELKVKF